MAKRNIEVKEKNLIERLNDSIRAKERGLSESQVKAAVNRDPETGRFVKAKKEYEAPKAEVLEKKDTQLRTPESDKGQGYEYVNHPKHYNNYDVEVIEMMLRIFGTLQTAAFSKLNAFKYRMRAGTKPDVTVEQDLDKERWYLRKYEELKATITDEKELAFLENLGEDNG